MSAFHVADWRRYWDGLTPEQQQAHKDKARWEHMSLSAVAMEWFGWKPSRCAYRDGAGRECRLLIESAIHRTDSANAEIRTAAHPFALSTSDPNIVKEGEGR